MILPALALARLFRSRAAAWSILVFAGSCAAVLGLADAGVAMLAVVAGAFVFLVVFFQVPRRGAVGWRRLVPLAFMPLIGWTLLRNIAAVGIDVDRTGAFLGSTLAVLSVALAGAGRQRRDADGFAAPLVGVYLGILVIAGSSELSQGWIDCRADKCSVFGSLYQGVFENGNAISLIALAGLALVPRTRARLPAVVLAAGFVFLLLASGARTSLVGLALGAITSLAIAWTSVRTRDSMLRPRPLIVFGLVTAVAVGGLLLAARATDPNYLSGRGRLWIAARESDELFSVFGAGSDAWERILEVQGLPDLSTHSQYVLLAVAGGAIAVGLFVLGMGVTIASIEAPDRRDLALTMLPAVSWLFVGLTEVAWNPATVNVHTSLFLLMVLVSTMPHAAIQPQQRAVAASA
ncbi:MAG: hypothetical protein GY925_07890 [Actinomycetia bacterium]|nr:hypothetical protein [Actinomycetes bacterium]